MTARSTASTRDARDLLVDGAGGRVVPLELERGVDVAQHGADARAVADDDRRAEQRAAADEPLRGADQLHAPARVDAVGARAVLAGHLPHARVDAERRERAREPLALGAEAVVGARRRDRRARRRRRSPAKRRGRRRRGRRAAAARARSRARARRRPRPRSRAAACRACRRPRSAPAGRRAASTAARAPRRASAARGRPRARGRPNRRPRSAPAARAVDSRRLRAATLKRMTTSVPPDSGARTSAESATWAISPSPRPEPRAVDARGEPRALVADVDAHVVARRARPRSSPCPAPRGRGRRAARRSWPPR